MHEKVTNLAKTKLEESKLDVDRQTPLIELLMSNIVNKTNFYPEILPPLNTYVINKKQKM